jgi:hypothetical protein
MNGMKRGHKSYGLRTYFLSQLSSGNFSTEEETPFPNCAANAALGISFKHVEDVHQAYRMYINARWQRDTIPLTWNYGTEPEWREQ